MSNEETHVVLCVLEGAIPDGRTYSELKSHELAIIVEALDAQLDGLISTKRDLRNFELKFHEEYMAEVAETLETIRGFIDQNYIGE
jgi:hypothetical protein